MAFPTTSILTNFTGSNEDPLSEGGNWSGPIQNGTTQCKRASNAGGVTTAPGQSYWTPNTFTDCEAYLDSVPTVSSTGKEVQLWARVVNPNNASTAAGYIFQWVTGTGFQCYRMTSGGTFNQIGSTDNSHTLANGEGIGVSVTGTGSTVTIQGYYKSGGTWTALTALTDTDALRLTAAGNIGFGLGDNLAVVDDFGGGTVVTTTVSSFRTFHAIPFTKGAGSRF